MNMILHDVHFRKFDLRQEDTLEHPQHLEQRFEAVVANPPFSAKWSARELFLADDRFSQYGRLAPKTKADFAFVQHMIHQLDDNGQMAVVLPHGVLFRGAAEEHIRRYIIEDLNILDAVIGLPANLFYGTSIPTCILVIKKCRENPDDILFIDSSEHFEKVGNQNELQPEDIDKIISTYRQRTAEDRYSYVAPMAEVKENGFNLNIPRYVDTFEPEKKVRLSVVAEVLSEASSRLETIDTTLRSRCKELSIPFPDGCNAWLLEQYKKGVMQKIFSQEIRFKDDDGKDFPDWEMDEVANRIERVPTKFDPKATAESFPCIELDSIEPDTGRLLSVYDSNEQQSTKGKFLAGDVLFGKLRPYLRKYARPDFEGVCSSEIWVLRGRKNVLNAFVYFLVQSEKYSRLCHITMGSKMPRADWNYISTSPLQFPSSDEQKIIADFLTAIDDKINLVAQQITHMRDFKKGLLQQMFV